MKYKCKACGREVFYLFNTLAENFKLFFCQNPMCELYSENQIVKVETQEVKK